MPSHDLKLLCFSLQFLILKLFSKWKNLHFPLVLVTSPWLSHRLGCHLQDSHCLLSENKGNLFKTYKYNFIFDWFPFKYINTYNISKYETFQAYLLYIRFRLIKKECINIIIKKSKMGDFFLLYMMGLNIDSVIFKEVVHELARKLGYHNKDIYESWKSASMDLIYTNAKNARRFKLHSEFALYLNKCFKPLNCSNDNGWFSNYFLVDLVRICG